MFNEHVQSSRAEQREQTRMRVIASAQRLFSERGFRSTTIRDIAADASVSVGTVMSVGDKDALLLAAFDEWIGVAQRGAPGLPEGDDAAMRIGRFVQPFLTMFEFDLPLAREYGAILARGVHRTEVFSELADSMIEQFAEIFAQHGLGDDAPAAARATYLAYLGLLMASAARGEGVGGVRAQLEDVVRVLARTP
ncbi:MAG: TetR/AcrR family transcriptional regulator [Gordonia sp. (in: high G+C Gram-positive bacteria)]|uniref:TetR/AcrR family transcriptional regulator n=1 Tax=Gordonia sp. (in: high G+C Gram-positive bacteria) TaxID=84139 RepID=UPI0039E27F2C